MHARKSRNSMLLAAAIVPAVWVSTASAQTNETENFTTNPSDWVNGGPPRDVGYGFSGATNNTGGASPAGEAGGFIIRDNERTGYGDVTLGGIISDDVGFSASGELFVGNSVNPDGDSLLGHFGKKHLGPARADFDLMGLQVLENDLSSFRFRVQTFTSDGTEIRTEPVVLNYADVKAFTYAYTPNDRTFTGTILGDNNTVLSTQSLVLPADESLALDTFGYTNGFNGTNEPDRYQQVFFDAVTYTRALRGDFDGNGAVTPGDFDLLGVELRKPAADPDDRLYDVNNGTDGDGVITLADRDAILTSINRKLGDTDLDGDVDLNDLGNLASGFQQPGASWARGDTDLDNDVDLNDLGNLATNFGPGSRAAYAAFEAMVPEPASLSLLALAAGTAVLRRRR